MTEQEAIYCLKAGSDRYPQVCEECPLYGETGCDHCYEDANDVAIKALEEIQQYRALGTVEELRVARDKQVAKKPICKEMPYSEEVGFNDEWHCPVCGAYIGYCTEGMSEPEQMEYCNECGQHIARDWSDEDESET